MHDPFLRVTGPSKKWLERRCWGRWGQVEQLHGLYQGEIQHGAHLNASSLSPPPSPLILRIAQALTLVRGGKYDTWADFQSVKPHRTASQLPLRHLPCSSCNTTM